MTIWPVASPFGPWSRLHPIIAGDHYMSAGNWTIRVPCLPTMSVFFIAFITAFILPPGSAAADARFSRLSEPGIVALMRHAQAPGTGDPASFRLDDCTTQRNLDRLGEAQAREIGAAIRAAGVSVDRIFTSQWCRCRDTAKLLELGQAENLPALNSFFRDLGQAGKQTATLREFLSSLPLKETVLMVTHYVNIAALTGRSVASGEVLLLKIKPDGGMSVVDEILIDIRS